MVEQIEITQAADEHADANTPLRVPAYQALREAFAAGTAWAFSQVIAHMQTVAKRPADRCACPVGECHWGMIDKPPGKCRMRHGDA